uniref:Oxidation resistance protein 1 n=1 Tax=Kryptolebias marmoratus TaxID=37003 RepID=A0A3Q2ZG13_KRYMA
MLFQDFFTTEEDGQKSQSVDIASQGFSPTLVPASPRNKAAPPVAKATTGLEVQENNTTNSKLRSPRCVELKRGYTIDTGQKKTPEKKDGRRLSFQRPKGTIEYSVESRDTINSISLKFDTTPNELVQLNKLFSRAVVPGQVLYVPDPDYVSSVGSSPSLSPISPLSPTSSEADLEKVTDSDAPPRPEGVHPPVFSALRQSRVVSSTSEEEEALTEKFLKINCKYITDGMGAVSGVLLVTPNNIMFDPHRMDPLVQAHGCEEYEKNNNFILPTDCSSTAPRSAGGSVSEDVFTETELSPIREEEQASNEDLRQDKSSDASTESVQTLTQVEVTSSQAPGSAHSSVSQEEPAAAKTEDNPPDTPNSSSSSSRPRSQSSATTSVSAAPQGNANQETDVSKMDTMQQGNEEKGNAEETQKDDSQDSAEGKHTYRVIKERKHRSHKFLCLRVGKPMKKTFVSNASASMQQYAQLGKKNEYWFAVPQERSNHLYVFFKQWSPDMYGEGVRGMGQEPGFMVVKKNVVSETSDDEPITERNVKEWEVVSLTEYHRRIDALNSEDLRSLCKRLQITTKEEVNSKHGTTIKAELEPETFKPNLREPSELLEAEQIEKLARHLPPRTIGYPWALAFGTSKHGMSIKTLYRAMQGQDTPVLLVIKDSDGQVFGALASEPFKVSDGFYGTGETFLFTFNPEFEVYKWTGDNMFFIKGDMDSLAFGGGSGEFGLWLDGDLYHGRSHSCKTFGNPMLSKKEDFYVQDIEIWAFE